MLRIEASLTSMDNFNHDIEYLRHCRKLIEQKLNWRPAEEWRNYEFDQLSEKILDATGVNLSTTTLKRVFGKIKYESLPSSVTLNTLANYTGFPSWMAFKSEAGNVRLGPGTAEKIKSALNKKAWLAGTIAVMG